MSEYLHQHKYTVSVGSGLRSDFEPVQIGESAADTLYRRVEYSLLACTCGRTVKQKVVYDEQSS